ATRRPRESRRTSPSRSYRRGWPLVAGRPHPRSLYHRPSRLGNQHHGRNRAEQRARGSYGNVGDTPAPRRAPIGPRNLDLAPRALPSSRRIHLAWPRAQRGGQGEGLSGPSGMAVMGVCGARRITFRRIIMYSFDSGASQLVGRLVGLATSRSKGRTAWSVKPPRATPLILLAVACLAHGQEPVLPPGDDEPSLRLEVGGPPSPVTALALS